MSEHQWLAEQFDTNRGHLRGVAYRMLGSVSEAEDAVQDAWLKVSRTDVSLVDNMGAWLTTVVARVCLDMLRARNSRREEPLDVEPAGPAVETRGGPDPEQQALLADSVGVALLVVLDTLEPAERLAFVLHDMFGMPFDEIAAVVGRSPAAARQLASRARRRVRGRSTLPAADLTRQRGVAEAFLSALRHGDFEGLLALLDPDVLVRIDATAAGRGGAREIRGARKWAHGAIAYSRAAGAALQLVQPALIDGAVGLVLASRGRLTRVLALAITDSTIVSVDIISDRARLKELDIAVI